MNRRVFWALGLFFILYFISGYLADFFIDYEWFRIHKGLSLFWVLFFARFNVHLTFGFAFAGLFLLNFLLIRFLGGSGRIFTNNILDRLQLPVIGSPRRALLIIMTLAVIAVGFIMGGAASIYWKEYLLYQNAVPFEGFPADPIFNMDMGFYVFSLPFYRFLYNWVMSASVIITLFSIAFHVLNGGIITNRGKLEFSLFARTHISMLLGLLVLLWGIQYRLSAYDLLFSQIGKFYGAGYTAINAKLVAYNVAMWLSFAASLLLFANVVIKSFKLPLFVLGAAIPAFFILGSIYPAIQQRFIVEPNELEKEKPYIQNNITFTREAYGLDELIEVEFPNEQDLTYNDIQKNSTIFENVRLWDWRPLKQTYRQLQELKPYYFFNDVDVDRYTIDGKKIAVNLAARELSIDQLSPNSSTWQNLHLIYTHGYGAVLSRVDKITSEGQPEMLIYDIPPKTKLPFGIDRPEIYYGEHRNGYIVTNTSIEPGEFDYPSGDNNEYTTYEGTGGTEMGSVAKRFLFALAFGDVNLLISGNIDQASRVHYRRNIKEMVEKYTPFIMFDDDPYLVISEGKLYWIIDGYTHTDNFPYSTPVRVGRERVNYIRNSVKVVIDAYNGEMDYYIADPDDPVIQAYAKIFSGIFKPLKEMPEDLQLHIRYPETIFNVQAHMLLRYHMTDTNVFYNNEDAWDLARQIYESGEEVVHSYYLVTRMPDEQRNEFILIQPYTPIKKNNMISFLTAKCDMPDYGKLKLYTLPKDKLSYGPLQIEARIDQNPEISEQLTLWSQKGSSVIRGNMLIVPIEDSLLFIEPIYLKAESSEMPELKRVVVSFADQIVMEKDLPTALEKLFYSGDVTFAETSDTEGDTTEQVKSLTTTALSHYRRAQQRMQAGDWAGYGKEVERLGQVLERLKEVTGE